MGKFTAGLTRIKPTEPGREEAAAAASILDQGTPAAQVAEAARPVQVGGVAFDVEQAPAPEAPVLPGSPEQLQQIQDVGHTAIDVTDTGEQVARPATPEETEQAYQEELQQGQRGFDVYDPETGTVQIPTAGIAKGNEGVDRVVNDMAKLSNALSPRTKQTVGPRGNRTTIPATGAFRKVPDELVGTFNKLGIAKPIKAGSKDFTMDEGAAAVGYLALMGAINGLRGNATVFGEQDLAAATTPQGVAIEDTLSNLSSKQQARVRKKVEDANTVSRWKLHEEIGKNFQQILAPSANIDRATGARVGEETGYVAPQGQELSATELGQLGHYILAGGESSGFVSGTSLPDSSSPLMVRRLKPGSAPGSTQYEYLLTEDGAKYLDDMGPVLDEVFPGNQRPVSLAPAVSGKPLGAAALTHKRKTKVPVEGESEITPTMQAALDVLGSTPNMINNEKLDFIQLAFADVLQKNEAIDQQARQLAQQQGVTDRNGIEAIKDQILQENPAAESPFASLFNQDRKSFNKRAKVAGKKYGVNSGIMDYKFSKQVKDASLAKVFKDIGDPRNPEALPGDAARLRNKAFYYSGTVIGNSGRIMVSNTEMNYQNNKLARYLVDNPKTTRVIKGHPSDGSMEENFFYVVARNVLEGADEYTPKRLVQKFKEIMPQLAVPAQQLAAAVQSKDINAINKAFNDIKSLPGINQEWGVRDEWGFTLDGLVEFGKYSALQPGQHFHTRLKAEGDGINNGSSIQGMQFGIDTILERAGVIYDSDGEVIPVGNMRKAVFSAMHDTTDTAIKDPDDRQTLETVLNIIDQSEDRGSLVKSLTKLPLMTTVYGKSIESHGDHIRDWMKENGEIFEGQFSDPETVKRIDSLLNRALVSALGETLGRAIDHQRLIKESAGFLLNAMEEIPFVQGANGYRWQSGGYQITYPGGKSEWKVGQVDEEGVKGKERATGYQAAEKVPSALEAKRLGTERRRVRDEEGNVVLDEKGQELWEDAEKERKRGSILRNQMAVNGTHNIDATIAQETMIEAGRRGLWGHQVFDAFIGDVATFGKILDIANEKFVDVNRKYDLLKAEKEAYVEAFERYMKKIDDADTDSFPLNEDTGIGLMLSQRLMPRYWKQKDGGALRAELTSKFGIKFKKIEKPTQTGDRMHVRYVLDWDNTPKNLNKAQMKAIIRFFDQNYGMRNPEDPKKPALNIREAFDYNISRSKQHREAALQRIKQQTGRVRQYN